MSDRESPKKSLSLSKILNSKEIQSSEDTVWWRDLPEKDSWDALVLRNVAQLQKLAADFIKKNKARANRFILPLNKTIPSDNDNDPDIRDFESKNFKVTFAKPGEPIEIKFDMNGQIKGISYSTGERKIASASGNLSAGVQDRVDTRITLMIAQDIDSKELFFYAMVSKQPFLQIEDQRTRELLRHSVDLFLASQQASS